jgi:hypothetical protein
MQDELEHLLSTQSDYEVIDEQGSLRDILTGLRRQADELQVAFGRPWLGPKPDSKKRSFKSSTRPVIQDVDERRRLF